MIRVVTLSTSLDASSRAKVAWRSSCWEEEEGEGETEEGETEEERTRTGGGRKPRLALVLAEERQKGAPWS